MKKIKRKQIEEENDIYQIILIVVLAIIGISIMLLSINFGGIDEAIQCKKAKGYWCNKYELETLNRK